MKRLNTLLLLFFSAAAYAQSGGPRLFLDLPSIYYTIPNLQMVGDRMGVGAETAFNLATHWSTLRAGGGAVFSVDPGAADVGESFLTTPYGILEAGGGLYRTNGNQCARTKQDAFTAMAVVGLRYNLDTRSLKPAGEENSPYGTNFCVGAELGYFFIRDVFKNFEISLRGNYFPKTETASVNFGFKMFLNLKAGRS
ncbi:MAG: hypothetical protein RL742_1420 [Bacteroidota bacterium]